MKKRLLLALLCLSLLPLAGCWDSVPLNRRGFVLGLGLDLGERGFQLTAEVSLLKKEGAQGESNAIITVDAPSVAQALSILSSQIDRVITLEHLQVVAVSRALAEKSMSYYTDHLFRESKMRMRANLLIFDGSPKDLFGAPAEGAVSSSHYLSDMLDTSAQGPDQSVVAMNMAELNLALANDQAFLLPLIVLEEEQIKPNGAAIFQERRMIGRLDERYIMSYKLINHTLSQGMMHYPLDFIMAASIPDGHAVFTLSQVKSHLYAREEGGQLYLESHIEAYVRLEELDSESDTVITHETLDEARYRLEAAIEADCLEYLRLCRDEYHCDLSGFASWMQDHEARWWREKGECWPELFQQAQFDVAFHVGDEQIGYAK